MVRRIGITSGDTDGVGLEVSCKALLRIKAPANINFILWRSNLVPSQLHNLLKKKFSIQQVSTFAEAASLKPSRNSLVEIVSSEPPARWVESAANACLSKSLSAMATGPLSKPGIILSGFRDIGHTEILQRVCNSKSAYMGFLGDKFSVVLVTGHLPLRGVSKSLSPEKIFSALLASRQLVSLLPLSKQLLPVGLLGLNPHAGDGGLLGLEELTLLSPLRKLSLKSNLRFDGPLVPDVAFQPKNWAKYSCYLALYHDQGLIPFKVIHNPGAGVHLTLGLPIKRTSVDHGTAKDIFGKNKANSESMLNAISWAIRWSKIQT